MRTTGRVGTAFPTRAAPPERIQNTDETIADRQERYMGRMLDSFRKAEWPNGKGETVAPAPRPPAQATEFEPADATDEGMPFIEVGGPGKLLVASPGLLVTAAPVPVSAASAP